MSKVFLYVSLILFSPEIFAQYDSYLYSKYKRISFDIQHTTFNDIVANSTNEVLELEPVLNLNVNLRFYRTYSLTIAHGESGTWSYNGLGFRMDLPGVFFLGGNSNDFVRKAKRSKWNSYMSFAKLMTEADGEPEKFVCDRLGFGLDAFIVGGFYLNTELNLFSYKGNQFLSPTVGVGFEF
ncbi:MAG: hypothetical protein IT287_07275 [Bdellovibrionaceae bacterium]|nr:hypothetical protein [Pseudobdellovibrionaceae bacterium]